MSFADRLRAFAAGLKRLSALWILLVNLIPVVCVLLFGWKAGVLLLLYWSENVIIGAFNVLKILASGVAWGRAGMLICLVVVPFFVFHYGLFCFGHGVFVTLIGSLGADAVAQEPVMSVGGLHDLVIRFVHDEPGFAWSLLAIVAYQAWAFLFDWLFKGRARAANPMVQMFEPYGRIVVLHITIIVGAMAALALGQPAWVLAVLAVMKTIFDLGGLRTNEMEPAKLEEMRAAMVDLNRKLGANEP